MGQLQLAMKNDWKEIDAMLHEQGFDLRVAFRINISGKKKYNSTRTVRIKNCTKLCKEKVIVCATNF